MVQQVAVLNVVGLSSSLLPHAPRIAALGDAIRITPVLPAVTCSVQSSMLTGLLPGNTANRAGDVIRGHGVVGNGWFNHEQQEIQFWKQSNPIVQGEKVWETAKRRDPATTCLNMFWWYNMYSSADWSVTPRPQYKADGRKLPDCYSHPPELRDELQDKLGMFPLFKFWGPMAGIECSQWIADATKIVHAKVNPTLTLVYLPHLDYGLQKLGPAHPDIPSHVADVDRVAGELIDYFHGKNVKVLVVSEYGIEDVDRVSGHIDINRRLREAGLLTVRREGKNELLDAGASKAFAVADHQVAHVYTKPGVVVDPEVFEGCEVQHIEHERAGQYVLVAPRGKWFTHDYWLDDAHIPDFARCVEIHRKPGYDPRELFTDKTMPAIAWRLFKKKLGFRTLMDVIPLDASIVRGTHGRVNNPPSLQPILIGSSQTQHDQLCTIVRDAILDAMFG